MRLSWTTMQTSSGLTVGLSQNCIGIISYPPWVGHRWHHVTVAPNFAKSSLCHVPHIHQASLWLQNWWWAVMKKSVLQWPVSCLMMMTFSVGGLARMRSEKPWAISFPDTDLGNTRSSHPKTKFQWNVWAAVPHSMHTDCPRLGSSNDTNEKVLAICVGQEVWCQRQSLQRSSFAQGFESWIRILDCKSCRIPLWSTCKTGRCVLSDQFCRHYVFPRMIKGNQDCKPRSVKAAPNQSNRDGTPANLVSNAANHKMWNMNWLPGLGRQKLSRIQQMFQLHVLSLFLLNFCWCLLCVYMCVWCSMCWLTHMWPCHPWLHIHVRSCEIMYSMCESMWAPAVACCSHIFHV